MKEYIKHIKILCDVNIGDRLANYRPAGWELLDLRNEPKITAFAMESGKRDDYIQVTIIDTTEDIIDKLKGDYRQ